MEAKELTNLATVDRWLKGPVLEDSVIDIMELDPAAMTRKELLRALSHLVFFYRQQVDDLNYALRATEANLEMERNAKEQPAEQPSANGGNAGAWF